MPEVEVGRVDGYFARPVVAGIKLTASLKVGDRTHTQRHTTDLDLVIESMQVDNADVTEAGAGQAVGVKVPERVRPGDVVYVVTLPSP